MTAMILKSFWLYYKFTGDADFLANRSYPILREGARFYADYVTLGDDGFYHILPTVCQENWGLTKNYEMNVDSTGALSQVKYHLLACVEAAKKLDRDPEERVIWKQVADRIAPYPRYETEDGPIFVDVRGNVPAPQINLFQDLSMVTFGDQIHVDSDPSLREIAVRTFARMYLATPELRRRCLGREHYFRAVERRLGLPGTMDFFEIEDLLMSYTGRMHLFAGVDRSRNARFERLLAFGGFEVSAEKIGERVEWARIKSLAGERCSLRNPWFPELPKVTREDGSGEPPVELDGDDITFDTENGTTYLLVGA
jgi:hypothetical protein